MEAVQTSLSRFSVDENLISRLQRYTVIVALVIGFVLSTNSVVHGETLTDLFRTKSFQGSWEVINKFNWVGWLMNTIISVFCFLGLCMVFFQRLISILYLSSRTLFDNVYDMKNSARGNKFFGFGAMGKDIYNANRGVGFDAIIGFGYSLLPNVKEYSDYNPEKRAYNLEEDDAILTYMMKTALPTILLVFFFAIGYSGTLAKAYGVVVDGMTAAADKAVDINLEARVNRILSTGESYKFTIGTNNTETGKFAEKVAKDIYSKVLSRMDIRDTESRMIVGKNVETWVWDHILGKTYDAKATKLQELARKSVADGMKNQINVQTMEDVTSLSYDVIVNNSSSLGGQASLSPNIQTEFLKGMQVTAASEESKSLTLHLIIRKDRPADVNFFVVPKKNG